LRVALAVGLLVLGYGILYDGLQQIANCPETFWGVMNPLTIYAPCTGSATGGSGSTSASNSSIGGVLLQAGENATVPGSGNLLSALGL
jgi:hypothetical protein